MVRDSKDEVFISKVDPCANCGRRVMSNLVQCTKCGKWVMRVTLTLVKRFVCEQCAGTIKGILDRDELSFYFQVKIVKRFCYLGDRLNASGGSKAIMAAKTRIGGQKVENVWSCLNVENGKTH